MTFTFVIREVASFTRNRSSQHGERAPTTLDREHNIPALLVLRVIKVTDHKFTLKTAFKIGVRYLQLSAKNG